MNLHIKLYTTREVNPKILDKDGASILPNAAYIQKLFAQFDDGKHQMQVGTIPRVKLTNKFMNDHQISENSLENAFMGTNAWVDGIRVMTDISDEGSSSVLVTLTIGSLDELNTPFSERTDHLKPNYAETQINFGDCNGGAFEIAVGTVDDEMFTRGALSKLIKATDKIVINLYSELLYNISKDKVAIVLGYQTDLLKALKPELSGRLKMGMEVAYLDKDIGTRGAMANDAFLPNSRFRLQFSGKVDAKGKIQWFAQKDFGYTNIVNVGAKFNINKK